MNSTHLITASHATEARPYAQAAFEYAKENKQLPQWEQLLKFSLEVVENLQMQKLLVNPKYLPEQKADFVIDIFKALKEKITPEQENFIKLLAHNNRFGLLASICLLYQTYLDEFNKMTSVQVITAFPIEPDQQARLEKALEKKFQGKIEISYEENKELLGGAMVCIGDEIINASIKSRLTQLKSALLEG